MNRQKLKVMKRRNKRLDNIKIDLYRQWTMFTRAPLLVLFASSLIGGMAITGYILGRIIIFFIGN